MGPRVPFLPHWVQFLGEFSQHAPHTPLSGATYLLHQSHSYWLLPPPPPQVVAGGQGPPGNRGLQCGVLPGSPRQVQSSPPGLGRQLLDSQAHLEEPLQGEKQC